MPGERHREYANLLRAGNLSRFEHGMSFVGVKALGDEQTFKVRKQGVEGILENRRGEGSLINDRAEDAVAEARVAPLEEDSIGMDAEK
jgi:hypothetical protein